MDGERRTGRSVRWRTIIAALALDTKTVVSYDSLAELIGMDPAIVQHPEKAVRSCVERIQEAFRSGGPHIRNQPGLGYWLDIASEEVDVHVFLGLSRQTRELASLDKWQEVQDVTSTALGLYRGIPLADVNCPGLEADWTHRLETRRIRVLQDQTRSYLHLGQHEDIALRLMDLTGEYPTVELFWALLMLAQYRARNRREALASYGHAQAALREYADAEPGEIIEEIHQRIRSKTPAMDIPVP